MARKLPVNKRNSRLSNSFNRREAKYPANETVLIVCEGETEVNYFNGFKKEHRLSSVQVKLCETGSAPINIVEYAIEMAENNEAIDRVFCVFDRDQHSTYHKGIRLLENHQFSENAKSKPTFKAIISVPCFEIWLLLHFIYTTKPYNQKGSVSPAEHVQKDLRRYLPEYLKSSSIWFSRLHEKLNDAIENAVTLKKENESTGSNNPATNIHELVNYLINIKGK